YRRFPPLAVVLLSLGFAPAPFPKPAKPGDTRDDLKKLQGVWTVVRRTVGGSPVKLLGETSIEIAGDRLKYVIDGKVRTEWRVRVDAAKKRKVLDRTKVGGARVGIVLRGIYRLEGETFPLCYRQAVAESQRPAGFDASQRGVWFAVAKRKKR